MPQASTEEGVFNVEDYKFLLEKFKFEKDVDEFINAVISRSKAAKIGIADAINYVCGDKPYKSCKKQCKLSKMAYNAYSLKGDKVKFTEYIKENLKPVKAQKETFKHFGFGEDKDKKSTKLKTRAESNLFSVTDKKNTIGDKGTDKDKKKGTVKGAFSGISEEQHNLYPINATSVNFVDDTNASNFILSRFYLPNEVRDVLAKKIISFQKDYAPNGYYYGRENNPRTNDNTIKHFINKCTYTNEKNPSWIPVTEENKALLERLKQELYYRYANR